MKAAGRAVEGLLEADGGVLEAVGGLQEGR